VLHTVGLLLWYRMMDSNCATGASPEPRMIELGMISPSGLRTVTATSTFLALVLRPCEKSPSSRVMYMTLRIVPGTKISVGPNRSVTVTFYELWRAREEAAAVSGISRGRRHSPRGRMLYLKLAGVLLLHLLAAAVVQAQDHHHVLGVHDRLEVL